MKRILFVEFSSGFGGSSEALFGNLKYLDHSKFYPVVLIVKEGESFGKMKDAGIEVIQTTYTHFTESSHGTLWAYLRTVINFFLDVIVNAPKIAIFIWCRHVDLIHVNTNIKNNLGSLLAAKLVGVPCVCHMRGTRPLIKMERIFGRFVDKIIILNKKALENLRAVFDSDRVELISDGIDLKICPSSDNGAKIRQEFGLNNDFCVGVIGRLVEGKGQDDFIAAAFLVKQKRQKVKFLIVGNDPEGSKAFEQRLKDMVRQLNLQGEVIFTGWRSDKYDIIQALDVVVHPTSTFPEGAPLILSEAMAFGKPVIATRIAGSADMVIDDVTGLFVTPGSPGELAEAITKLANSKETVQRLGLAGRRHAEEYFDVEKNTKQFERLYEDLLNRVMPAKKKGRIRCLIT